MSTDKTMGLDPAIVGNTEEGPNVKPVSIFELIALFNEQGDALDALNETGSPESLQKAREEWNKLERAIHFHPIISFAELLAKAKFICEMNVGEANPNPEELKPEELGYWALQRDIEALAQHDTVVRDACVEVLLRNACVEVERC